METSVLLSVRDGVTAEKHFVFHSRTLCTIGRAPDCEIQLRGPGISRHHCVLDVEPPSIRIRDWGSLNGTFVNGQKIGQRNKNQQAEDNLVLDLPEVALAPGDEFRVWDAVFHVSVEPAEETPELVEA